MNSVTATPAGPTVSVLMPVYNAEAFVRDAIDSILAQTYVDFEFLLFDDGSQDHSLAILREYERRDPRVRVFTRENRGVTPTRNELIGLSIGKYVAMMDADDVCLPQRLGHQVALLDENPDHVLVGAWLQYMNEKGQPIGVTRYPVEHSEIDAAHLKGFCSFAQSVVTVRRAALEAVRGYNVDFPVTADFDLWLRLAEIGKIHNLPEILIKIRVVEEGISGTASHKQNELARLACERAWSRRGISGEFRTLE